MGGLLTQPVTHKSSDKGEGLGLRYGVSSMQGWRPEMEDAHDIRMGLQYGLVDWSFFAVFDGHAGKYAAAFAAWNLLDFILKDSQFELGAETSSEHVFKAPPVESYSSQPPSGAWLPESDTILGKSAAETEKKLTNEEQQKITSEDSTEPPKNDEILTKSSSTNVETTKQTEDSSCSMSTGDDKHTKQTNEDTPKSKFVTSSVVEQLDMVKSAIRSGFLKIDQSMRINTQDMSGCTAVCTLVSPTHLFIANCGDSRAVLYDGTSAKFATEDHKPFHPKERKRIIDAGGTATVRINGTLAVSRALGDFEFKKDNQRGPCEQLVSPEPEITVIERHSTDEFLILACDGIWDVMNNTDLCLYIRYLLEIEPNLEKICSSVLDVCLRKGSRDNMSIIIIVFETAPKVSDRSIDADRQNDRRLLEIAKSFYEKNPENELDFTLFLHRFKNECEQQLSGLLPPGAGIEAKYDLLREQYEVDVPPVPQEEPTTDTE